MAQNTVLFLGAGANVGAASVELFKNKGYKVAAVARTIRDEVAGHSDLVITADFSDPSAMQGVFDRIEQELGVPNVVIYNPYSWSRGPDPANPISASVSDFQRDVNTTTISAYAAAQCAVKGFDKLPATTKKTVFFTGNGGNTWIMPAFFALCLTKSSIWYMVQTLVATPLFASQGYRFYYVDERTPEGKGMMLVSGPGHADFFHELAERDGGQGEALATFVRGRDIRALRRVGALPCLWVLWKTVSILDTGRRGRRRRAMGSEVRDCRARTFFVTLVKSMQRQCRCC